jgi:hypothetical protein
LSSGNSYELGTTTWNVGTLTEHVVVGADIGKPGQTVRTLSAADIRFNAYQDVDKAPIDVGPYFNDHSGYFMARNLRIASPRVYPFE